MSTRLGNHNRDRFLHNHYVMLITCLIALNLKAAPEIAHITEPACNGEIVIITGEGFTANKIMVKALGLGVTTPQSPTAEAMQFVDAIGTPPTLPATPPPEALDCPILGAGDHFLQVTFNALRCQWLRAPYTTAVWVGDGQTWSQPILVNRPKAQWIYPQIQAPGESIRVFGRTFAWGSNLKQAQAVIRCSGTTNVIPLRTAARHHEDAHTSRWCLEAWLPENLPLGDYELFVHGHHGGSHGWSDPLNLTVQAPDTQPRRIVNIRDHGACGDGLNDDTSAFEAALKEAAPGGTLLLPTGTYALSHTIEIPDDLIIQGSGMHQTIIANQQQPAISTWQLTASHSSFKAKRALLTVMNRVALRDLTIRFMPATGAALRVGVDPAWSEDVSLYRVRLEIQQDIGLAKDHPYCARPLNIIKARRFSMIRCETYGPGGVSCERKVEESLFSQNRFLSDRRWRGSIFKFWGAEHVIFEDNLMTGDTRGLVMQTHFGVNYQNFIAGNTVERTVLGVNAGETYLVEGAGYLYESHVSKADLETVTTTQWPTLNEHPATANDCLGRFVVIAQGRGLGQWRRITSCDPDNHTLKIDHPWRVTPDVSSVVVVMNGLIDTVFVNNQEIDCGKGLYLYGAGAINNIIDRHLCDRTMGITLMTHDERQDQDPQNRTTYPDFFNLIRDCRIHDGGGLLCSAGGRLPLITETNAPLANFGNRFLENEIQNVVPFSGTQYGANWTWGNGWDNVMAGISVIPMDLGQKAGGLTNGPPRIIANVFDKNWVSGSRIGIGISKRADHTLLSRTTLYNVAVPLDDHGTATQNVDPVLRTDDNYTPERGPIR